MGNGGQGAQYGRVVQQAVEVRELRSGYLRNNGGSFEFVPFSEALQVATILELLPYDFDGDGDLDLAAAPPCHGQPHDQGHVSISHPEASRFHDLSPLSLAKRILRKKISNQKLRSGQPSRHKDTKIISNSVSGRLNS